MKKISLIGGIICGALFANNAFAMDLSLTDTVSKITAQSQDLKKADANVKKARASLSAVNANRWMNIEGSATYMNLLDVKKPFDGEYNIELPPSIGGAISGDTANPLTKLGIPDNILMTGVDITQPIYTFGKIGNAVDSVHSAIKISNASKELTTREVKYAAANIYWTAKMADGAVAVSQKTLDNAIDARKKLTSAGRANRGNLIKIESDIAVKEINLSDAEFNRDTAYRMLKILAGIDMNEDIKLTDEMPAKFATAQSSELKSNPEWDIYEQQISMYESNARSKRAGHYPTLAAMASYSYVMMNNDIDVYSGNKNQSLYWGLALKVPIFDGGLARANANVERMNAEGARQDLDKSKQLKSEEYNTAFKKYEHLKSNLSNLENARDLAEKAYNISGDRFAAGQTSAIELAEVSAALSQLDMALLNAKYNLLMSAETIKKLGN